jgi:integrase
MCVAHQLSEGDRGGYLGYAMWRRYLTLAQGYTAAHPDGAVSHTAHELRHVCASLLIASGASDMQVARQMGHSKIEATKNIYFGLPLTTRWQRPIRHGPSTSFGMGRASTCSRDRRPTRPRTPR